MIRAEKLTRKYGDFTAVDDVSFEIESGEIVGLLGHNGAGKTTIMKVLTGFLEPTSGDAFIDGHNVSEERLLVQSKIGYLPENCPVYPEMTVVDYLEYVATLRSIPESEIPTKVRDVISQTKLEPKATALISTLSRGYQQRVGVAQAIIHEPQFLILDEPTNGLDPSQIHGMRELIQRLSQHSTVILSTHILQEVQAVCDRVIIILNGRVALDSKLKDLQHSNRMILAVDQNLDQTREKLSGINGVKDIYPLEQHGNERHFVLDIEPNGQSLAPQIAKAVIAANMNLYALHPEQRDLESVFREINLGEKGGSHAE